MPATVLRVPQSVWSSLCSHVLRGDDCERLAFLLAGVCRRADTIELLVAEHEVIADENLVAGASTFHVEAKPEALVAAVNRAVRAGLALVEVHNHPHTVGPCGFSPSDRSGFRETVPYMLVSLKIPLYAAVVLGGPRSADGLVWLDGGDGQAIDRIEVVGPEPHTVRPSGSRQPRLAEPDLSEDALARFDRQVRAFGRLGQVQLMKLRVGVVGLGGIGSLVVQELARLGVSDFALVDPDIIDVTSLNRVGGATRTDADQKRLKVAVAAEQIQAANPDAAVRAYPVVLFNGEAVEVLSGVDLVIGCTDDAASRFALNEISLAYLRPYLDLATEIHTADTMLEGVGGRFTFLFPGTGCLLCARAIDAADAAEGFTLPEVRNAQRRSGYIRGGGEAAPAVMPLNGTIASLAAFEVFAWAAGVRPPLQQRIFDALRCTLDAVTFRRDAKCVACNDLLGRGELAGLVQKYSRWAVPERGGPTSRSRRRAVGRDPATRVGRGAR